MVNFAGDAVLADFSSVVAALACAVEFQRGLTDSNADKPDDNALRFRVGINLGDVIVDRENIYGDGVNVAARLQEIAQEGGICISAPPSTKLEIGPITASNIWVARRSRILLSRSAATGFVWSRNSPVGFWMKLCLGSAGNL